MLYRWAVIPILATFVFLLSLLDGNDKVKFNLMSKCTGKYLNSPLYRDAALWDELGRNVQDQKIVSEIMKLYRVYKDLLH